MIQKMGDVRTCLQDPQWPDSAYLLEEILGECEGATSGVGAFAFASAAGVNLLLGDPQFSNYLAHHPFELVVGVDAITDTDALDAVHERSVAHPSLKVRVFLGTTSGSLFHPKVCWFRRKSGGVCLVGSGNLTAGGLRGNCESFAVVKLGLMQMQALDRMWASWSDFHNSELLPLNDARVRKQASENARQPRLLPEQESDILVEQGKGKTVVGPAPRESAEVLIAEIPRGGSRWNQANFDLGTFRNFFGASPGHTQRILLTHVDVAGHLGSQEIRPSVAVKSYNYRFELDAASGLEYPAKGRPVTIFVKVATRTFRYRLLMPGTQGYREVSDYLKTHAAREANRVRRLLTSVRALRGAAFFRKLTD
jgi:hypothetical protein